MKNLWKLPTAQAWSWQCKDDKQKMALPSIGLLISWSLELDSNTKKNWKSSRWLWKWWTENSTDQIWSWEGEYGQPLELLLLLLHHPLLLLRFTFLQKSRNSIEINVVSFCLQFIHSSLGQCWRSELFARNVPMSISERPKPSLLDRLLYWWLPANLTSSFWGKIKCNHLTEKPQYDVKKQSIIVRISKMKNYLICVMLAVFDVNVLDFFKTHHATFGLLR